MKKEIRLREGKLDEVVGVGYYHLEQMTPTHWGIAFDEVHVNLYLENGEIKAIYDDEGGKHKIVEQEPDNSVEE